MFERLAFGIAVVGIAILVGAPTPAAAPGPVLGVGLSGLVVAGFGIYAWYRNRK